MTSRNVIKFYRWSEAIIFALGEVREPEKSLIGRKRVLTEGPGHARDSGS